MHFGIEDAATDRTVPDTCSFEQVSGKNCQSVSSLLMSGKFFSLVTTRLNGMAAPRNVQDAVCKKVKKDGKHTRHEISS
uniref:Uncharacterized protein n=1 Tax=Romanomermis culicivorax TaxID=13658 RepID=A0A915IFA1_ROMCU